MLPVASLLIAVLISTSFCAESTKWSNVTGTSNTVFPTDVGNLGDTAPGLAPMTAQDDTLNSTEFVKGYGIDMRSKPLGGNESTDIYGNFGPYTTWRPAESLFPETNPYRSMPPSCQLRQVHILHRHGARYPTDGMDDGPGLFGAMVKNGTRNGTFHATGDLAFLNHLNYTIGQALLVHQGAQELFDSGVKHYYEYGRLLSNMTTKPVIRTTSSSRVLDSSRYWTLGFFGWDANERMNLEVLTEAKGQNNTLEPKYACPNGKKFAFGDQMRKEWQKVYLKDALKRWQKNIHGLNLTIEDMFNIIQVCPYETAGMGFSKFCSLFTKEEWEGFEYDGDLKFQGNSGFMSPMGRAMGIGYVQEFLARVSNHTITNATSQNTTLDRNETYFPLDQRLYADFTHDSAIVNILTAFNLTQIGDHLKATKPNKNRRFRASAIVPFGARVAFEVLECAKGEESTPFIRIKINDAVVPLNEGQGCRQSHDGLCSLSDFKKQLQDSIKASHFDLACFGKNGTDFSVTSPVSQGQLSNAQIHTNQTA
ncbi:hypothetical protein MCAP1_001286 [Malassezia caprae]|uniref:3-phytase n=1 Tax=Malassezia caprae TaxID=1381934 RepID=A0AAF0E7N9_9BASI|nr:hypothetical protein MCAP1_001286 [Malassezia caprae]